MYGNTNEPNIPYREVFYASDHKSSKTTPTLEALKKQYISGDYHEAGSQLDQDFWPALSERIQQSNCKISTENINVFFDQTTENQNHSNSASSPHLFLSFSVNDTKQRLQLDALKQFFVDNRIIPCWTGKNGHFRIDITDDENENVKKLDNLIHPSSEYVLDIDHSNQRFFQPHQKQQLLNDSTRSYGATITADKQQPQDKGWWNNICITL
jgi:hypothetical protein